MSTDNFSTSPTQYGPGGPSASTSPPQYGRIPKLRGWLPLNNEDASPMATHGQGALTSLIKTRSSASLQTIQRRSSSILGGRETPDEEAGNRPGLVRRNSRDPSEADDFRRSAGDERRMSAVLFGPQMRSQRLIGSSNPRYRWEKYWKTEEELKDMKKPIREYYERTNSLLQQYIYIDRLLDSSLPHDLLNEYNDTPSSSSPGGSGLQNVEVPPTITEEPRTPNSEATDSSSKSNGAGALTKKVKRTPREIYKISDEQTPLLGGTDDEDGPKPEIPGLEDDSVESGDRIVQIAIYVNLAANAILLAGKIAVIVLTSSLSVLASLVDAALDFLSTGIVWTTTKMIERQDQYHYPVGRRRLEPIGVLVFSVIMITSFFQVGLECISRLRSGDHSIIQLGLPAIIIMSSTVFIKALCWFFCRLIKNSSVQALAQDAMTDVVFNIFSIIFPLSMDDLSESIAFANNFPVGYYAELWWLDALGGLLLSLFVIFNWAGTSAGHIRNLTGRAATADERNVLLYLTMRFAKTIKQIQGLQAYHAGDKLNVEVDIVLDENMSLRDSHDLGESLQYVLESVPTVDRAFVHQDYAGWNLPTHMQQQGD
ncbi:Metal tolerance protein 3 [Lachnellula arida]|uniref:Metal tolerance protein 3 n=1 Tax=Lachnellula arida TaxID=1316785 RepID=A0A8T9B4J1_9HELO|nr:Metal tolerance protein 3 [Lachnellula arida]